MAFRDDVAKGFAVAALCAGDRAAVRAAAGVSPAAQGLLSAVERLSVMPSAQRRKTLARWIRRARAVPELGLASRPNDGLEVGLRALLAGIARAQEGPWHG